LPSHFLSDDLEDVDDLLDLVEDLLDLVDPTLPLFEFCRLDWRKTNPNSSYISWVWREEAEVDGMKRLKDGEEEAVVGRKE